MTKHTPWFDGGVKPEHPGVYQRRRPAYQHVPNQPERILTAYSRWNGSDWMVSFGTIGQASRTTSVSAYQYVSWRGLSEQSA